MAITPQRNTSTAPDHRMTLTELSWEDINEPGAYIEVGSGDLYRVPKEALVPGASPVIQKQSSGQSRFVRLSPDPFVITLKARLVACEHNIEPNF